MTVAYALFSLASLLAAADGARSFACRPQRHAAVRMCQRQMPQSTEDFIKPWTSGDRSALPGTMPGSAAVEKASSGGAVAMEALYPGGPLVRRADVNLLRAGVLLGGGSISLLLGSVLLLIGGGLLLIAVAVLVPIDEDPAEGEAAESMERVEW